MGHTVRRCPQPVVEEETDKPSFSPPGTPPHGVSDDRVESAPGDGDDNAERYQRRDQDDRW